MLASCDGTLSRSENDATTAIDDAPGGPGNMRLARDLNPDPDILEVNLVAAVRQVELNDSGLMANAHTFNGTIPGPELRMKVGDTAIIHFTNRLPRPMSIHWHGIELDNANDGTVVTQNPVPTGETFTYRFVVPRPGVFWYHPHAMPSRPVWHTDRRERVRRQIDRGGRTARSQKYPHTHSCRHHGLQKSGYK
jgi:hypothetical protein